MKKSLALAVVMLIIIASLHSPLEARVRRGSTVVVTMADGSRIEGELLAVKTDTLLVYDQAARQGKVIDLPRAVRVKVLKNSKALLGIAIGMSAGFVIRLFDFEGQIHHNASMKPVLISALIGGAYGTLAGIPKIFSRNGKFFLSAQDLAWLRRHAREEG